MKKLTAGIFTVLMGLVSVNAADAAVASKLYVDQQVGNLNTTVGNTYQTKADAATMQTAIDGKVAKSDYDAKVQELTNVDSGLNTRLQAVEALNGSGEGSVSAQIKAVEDAYKAADEALDGKISAMDTAYKAADEALDGKISAMDTAYKAADTTLDGKISAMDTAYKAADEVLNTELAKKVNKADAKLDEVGADGSFIKLVSQADGKVAATPEAFVAEINEASKDSTVAPQTKAVKSYVDGAISTQGTQVTKLSGRVGALETAVDNALDENAGILAQANAYADQAELDAISAAAADATSKANAAQSAAEGKVTELANGAVKTNTEAIAAINNAENGILAQAKADATSKANAAQSAAEGKVTELANGAVKANTDAITAINNAETGILAQANAYADQAEADAITAANGYTDTEIAKLNLNELSRVPAECGVSGKYCVLTSDGTNYLWEVIERATDEVQPTGTAIPAVTQ